MWLLNKLTSYAYLENWLSGLSTNPNFFFAQIGANDGLRNDPIHKYVRKYGWKGILVEPQLQAYKALVKNYAGHCGLIFENVAIGEADGEIELFTIDEDVAQEWHDLIATVNPEVGILKEQHRKVVSRKVPALTLESLFDKHGIEKLDLLLMDLEGYEPKLFKCYSWNIKPDKIYFETRHLGYMQFQEVQSVLMAQGYRLFTERGDCLAWLK